MKRPVEHLAEGLGHPEGPDVLPDGRIVFVETYTSRIAAWSPERGVHLYADCGGGPNACVLGSDGCVYITQNGGTVGPWKAEVMSEPSIQKAWPDGRVEIICTEIDGRKLLAPNDLSFGPDGRLYFTDPGRVRPRQPARPGLPLRAQPRRQRRAAARSSTARTPTASWSRRTAASCGSRATRCTCTAGAPTAPSRSCTPCRTATSRTASRSRPTAASGSRRSPRAASTSSPPDGTPLDFLETGGVQCNCIFHDGYLYLTDFGEGAEVTSAAPMIGRLSRVPVDVEGMPLYRGAIG